MRYLTGACFEKCPCSVTEIWKRFLSPEELLGAALCSRTTGTIPAVSSLSTEITLMSLTDNQTIMENGHSHSCHLLG